MSSMLIMQLVILTTIPTFKPYIINTYFDAFAKFGFMLNTIIFLIYTCMSIIQFVLICVIWVDVFICINMHCRSAICVPECLYEWSV